MRRSEALMDAVRMRIERAHEDIEIGRVVSDLRFGAESRLFPFSRPPFFEIRNDGSDAPNFVVVFPVDYRRDIRARRRRAGIGRGTDGD